MSYSVKKWHEMKDAGWIEPRYVQQEDEIVTTVIRKFKKRSQEGIQEYGMTLADNQDGFYKWIDEAQS